MSQFILRVSVVALFSIEAVAAGDPITLKGANGRATAFDGIREAVPGGLWIRVTPGSEAVAVSWDKLDLAALQTDHPKIYEASASLGRSRALPVVVF